MDGIDGVLAGSILVCLITFAFMLSGSVWTLIGSLFGFLIWNWKPSKIFMGDIGSTFLGSFLFLEIIRSNSFNDAFFILSVALPILFDAFSCVIRRFFNNENIFRPHKKHLYQRLVKAGFSHFKVTFVYSMSSIFILLACLTGNIIIVSSSIMIFFNFDI